MVGVICARVFLGCIRERIPSSGVSCPCFMACMPVPSCGMESECTDIQYMGNGGYAKAGGLSPIHGAAHHVMNEMELAFALDHAWPGSSLSTSRKANGFPAIREYGGNKGGIMFASIMQQLHLSRKNNFIPLTFA